MEMCCVLFGSTAVLVLMPHVTSTETSSTGIVTAAASSIANGSVYQWAHNDNTTKIHKANHTKDYTPNTTVIFNETTLQTQNKGGDIVLLIILLVAGVIAICILCGLLYKCSRKVCRCIGHFTIDGNDSANDGLICDSVEQSESGSPLIQQKGQIALKYSSNWKPVSVRWKQFLEDLLKLSNGNLKEVNNVCFSKKSDMFRIGSGNKTEVFLGIGRDGKEVALKRFPMSMSKNFEKEKALLMKCNSPNIIRYYDSAKDDDFLYLILELGEFTLNEFISTNEYKQNQSSISRDFVRQILETLGTLHTGYNVIHMDIKPHNVLIDVKRRVKLFDFGISVTLPDDQSSLYTTAKGTNRWVAKEILDSASGNTKYEKLKYKKSADIQVAGMLVYYTLTGGIHPFMPNGEADVFLCNKNVQDGKHDLSALDDIVGKHLVDWMLQPDPELRPTMEEALAHPFIWNADMRYRFLGVLGDEKEVKESWKQQPHSVTLTLDGLTVSVFNTVAHWKDLLDQTVYDEFAKPMRNGYRSTICGLLRFIRNVDVHLKDKPPPIRATVGIPMTYFIARLPFDELFLKVYKTVRDTRSSADDWTVRWSLKEFFSA
ncbi:serine/threonine-protein kinase ppk4-like isoform X2 [Lingula anatina]|uniref:Serine/threonine-protein kinase ppk4-like isoform X2 n=1 Tax=Lingula anatina TaxID=7574 RepID=A0A1S3JUR7_LINAN|nr:serine/threonine-protein kinase ppk4-like isoform X2 [Lingula anatina]|eukprot:XP_013414115.1 serine/threonine-protein kinase ppk4-like isoform X2 [Lingula anatina]